MGVSIDSGSDHMGFRTVATKKMIQIVKLQIKPYVILIVKKEKGNFL
jgi:hypothetical protein